MSEKRKAELTAHYCPNIDDNVFVMSTVANKFFLHNVFVLNVVV